MSEYIYLVQMDVKPDVEAEFNRVYDEQHVPLISKVPGVLDVDAMRAAARLFEGRHDFVDLSITQLRVTRQR